MVDAFRDEMWDYTAVIRADIQNAHRDPQRTKPILPESCRPKKKSEAEPVEFSEDFGSFTKMFVRN